MPKRPEKDPKQLEITASALTIAGGVISLIALVLEKYDRLASFVRAVDSALSWHANVGFAFVTEVLPACGLLYLCWRTLRSAKKQPPRIRAQVVRLLAATAHFSGAAGAYYLLLLALGSPGGPRSVGNNVALELVNLYIGFAAWELARLIDGDLSAEPTPARKYAPLIGMGTLTALFLGVSGCDAAVWFGLDTEDALRCLTAFGSTFFVAGCGWRLLWASRRATWFARLALGTYAVGLSARVLMIFFSSWTGILGLTYFGAMAAKWGVWAVVAFTIARLVSKPHTCANCGAERDDDANFSAAISGEAGPHCSEPSV